VHKDNTLDEWLQYIETAHAQTIDMGLERVRRVVDRLSLDFSTACIVTVAGTNGKGTTCRFIEQACLHTPYRVGVYASPHIVQFNERIRVCGVDAEDTMLCAAFAKVYDAAKGSNLKTGEVCEHVADDRIEHKKQARIHNQKDAISLSYFEYATLCALVIFAESKLDIWILEVGLGGRLDATNIVDAHIGVITSIGLDHQAYLGDTTNAIAAEKAGIIKPDQQVVIGYSNMHQSVDEILKRLSNYGLLCDHDFGISLSKTDAVNSSFTKGWINVHGNTDVFSLQNTKIPPQNIMTALATLHLISKFFSHPEHLLLPIEALKSLIDTVSVPGRFEVISESPHIILDVAHNEDSAKYLLTRMQQIHFNKCHIVMGMLKDKNIEATIDQLSALNARWYCVDLPTVRGEKADRLQNAVHKHKQQAEKFANVALGLQQAIVNYRTNDIILAVGSFILASDFKQALADYKR
jgi:dihydrofolate synthase/folylpolyglutamate synthase